MQTTDAPAKIQVESYESKVRSIIANVDRLDSDTLRSLNAAVIDELNHRVRAEQRRRASAVTADAVGQLTNIKPRALMGIRVRVVRLSSDPKWCYVRAENPLGMAQLRRYERPDGTVKMQRSCITVEA